MEKLIHQYLDENYFPYKEDNDHYRIYHNDMELEVLFEIQPTALNKTLKDIYGVHFEEVKLFVYTWSIKYFPDIDLTKYWGRFVELDKYFGEGTPIHNEVIYGVADNNFDNFQFPVVRRVFSTLIANDLVSVQPLSAPKGILQYIDYVYKPKQTFKQKVNSVLDKMKIFIRKMEKDIRKYLHITNYNATFVTQEK